MSKVKDGFLVNLHINYFLIGWFFRIDFTTSQLCFYIIRCQCFELLYESFHSFFFWKTFVCKLLPRVVLVSGHNLGHTWSLSSAISESSLLKETIELKFLFISNLHSAWLGVLDGSHTVVKVFLQLISRHYFPLKNIFKNKIIL